MLVVAEIILRESHTMSVMVTRINTLSSNPLLVPTPGTARQVSFGFRGRRGTAARCAS